VCSFVTRDNLEKSTKGQPSRVKASVTQAA